MYQRCQIISHKPTPSTEKVWTCWQISRHRRVSSCCATRRSPGTWQIRQRRVSGTGVAGTQSQAKRKNSSTWCHRTQLWRWRRGLGVGCSQFTKKCDFVSATIFFNHDFYTKIQQRRVEVGFCYVLKPEDSIFGCVGGTGGGQWLQRSVWPNTRPLAVKLNTAATTFFFFFFKIRSNQIFFFFFTCDLEEKWKKITSL